MFTILLTHLPVLNPPLPSSMTYRFYWVPSLSNEGNLGLVPYPIACSVSVAMVSIFSHSLSGAGICSRGFSFQKTLLLESTAFTDVHWLARKGYNLANLHRLIIINQPVGKCLWMLAQNRRHLHRKKHSHLICCRERSGCLFIPCMIFDRLVSTFCELVRCI